VYRWVEHTSELELEIEATSEDAVYCDAVDALAELLGEDGGGTGPAEPRRLTLEAPDRARLLAELLSELTFLAESERFVPVGLDELSAGPGRLEATVRGVDGHPRQLVKAVTYHRLTFEERDGAWRATVVLDV
jgi:SHS2 domain-containing protein